MKKVIKKKTVKKPVARPKTEEGSMDEEDIDALFTEVQKEVSAQEAKRDHGSLTKSGEDEETKEALFENKGPPAPIFKIAAMDDQRAMLYGKARVDLEEKKLREEGHTILERYPVKEPFSYVIIYVHKDTREVRYHAIEPSLRGKEREIFDFVVDTLSRIMHYNPKIVSTPQVLKRYLERKVEEIIKDMSIVLPPGGKERLMYFLLRDYIGYSKFQIFMDDDNLEDISCDGVKDEHDNPLHIFVYHKKYEQIKTNVTFMKEDGDEDLNQSQIPAAKKKKAKNPSDVLNGFVVSLAQKAGRYISMADPILDATMPDGSRINMTYGSEVTTHGSTISIRKFNANPLTITDIVKYGTLSPMMAAHLWLAVQYQDSMLFVGGAASGKTATMNATAMFIPWESKIISIEDTREVNIPQENWLPGVTRETGGKGGQDITMYTLLRAALRQRPEYLLVGEVRGKETMTMFQAMATGHTTYSTMHGESAEDVIHHLENKPINVPRVLLEALNLMVVHTNAKIKGRKVRRVKEMKEILEYVPTTNEIKSNTVYEWIPASDTFKDAGHSKLLEKIAERENRTEEEVKEEQSRRAEIIQWMVDNNINYYKTVAEIVQKYYMDSTHRFSDRNIVIKLIREGRGSELIGNETL